MSPPGGRRPRFVGERGSGTLLVAAVMLVVMVVAGVAVVLAGYVAAQHGAAGAADLAALSGSAAYVRGQNACVAARAAARDNGTTLQSCSVSGDSFGFVVRVSLVRRLRAPPGLPATVTAKAEAGRLAGG